MCVNLLLLLVHQPTDLDSSVSPGPCGCDTTSIMREHISRTQLDLCNQNRNRTCMRNFLGSTPMARCPPIIIASTLPPPDYFRKAEDGCVDICFYDWRYFGSYTSSLTFQLFNEGVRLPNQPKCNPIPQWDCFTPLTNDSEDICALLRGFPEFSIPWP